MNSITVAEFKSILKDLKIQKNSSYLLHSSLRGIGLIKGITSVAKKLNISVENGDGYRTLANIAENGGQEVPHLHFHLFGGEKIGKMVS